MKCETCIAVLGARAAYLAYPASGKRAVPSCTSCCCCLKAPSVFPRSFKSSQVCRYTGAVALVPVNGLQLCLPTPTRLLCLLLPRRLHLIHLLQLLDRLFASRRCSTTMVDPSDLFSCRRRSLRRRRRRRGAFDCPHQRPDAPRKLRAVRVKSLAVTRTRHQPEVLRLARLLEYSR